MDKVPTLAELITEHEPELLQQWLQEQIALTRQQGMIAESELRQQCVDFLRLLRQVAPATPGTPRLDDPIWDGLKELLESVSSTRASQGFRPSEVATFVFSFKRPFFDLLGRAYGSNASALAREVWSATELIDQLGLYTTEAYQKTREEIIARQQNEMLELSTPVVKLWDGILALPLIGTLDSARTQVVMETLLQKIVDTGSTIAIIDITGVPTVDTLVAQHLLKAVTAARLMGADCIISGIRPQIAQTIVHLGVALGDVTTKANLADAFQLALRRAGVTLSRSEVGPR